MEDGPTNEDHFAMSVEGLDAVCASLTANGYAFLVEPRDFPWGRSAYLGDPEWPARGARSGLTHEIRSAGP